MSAITGRTGPEGKPLGEKRKRSEEEPKVRHVGSTRTRGRFELEAKAREFMQRIAPLRKRRWSEEDVTMGLALLCDICIEKGSRPLTKELVAVMKSKKLLSSDRLSDFIRKAMQKNDVELLSCLVDEDTRGDPDLIRDHGRECLVEAIRHGKNVDNVVQFLLENGVDRDVFAEEEEVELTRKLKEWSIGTASSRRKGSKRAHGGKETHQEVTRVVRQKAGMTQDASTMIAALAMTTPRDINYGDKHRCLQLLARLCALHGRDAETQKFIDFLKQKEILTPRTDIEPFIESALQWRNALLLSQFVDGHTKVSKKLQDYIRTNAEPLMQAAQDQASTTVESFLRNNGAMPQEGISQPTSEPTSERGAPRSEVAPPRATRPPADPPKEANNMMLRIGSSSSVAPRDRERCLWILEALCVHHAHRPITEEFIAFLKDRAILTRETPVEPFIERALIQNDMALLSHFVDAHTPVPNGVRDYIRSHQTQLLTAASRFQVVAAFLENALWGQ